MTTKLASLLFTSANLMITLANVTVTIVSRSGIKLNCRRNPPDQQGEARVEDQGDAARPTRRTVGTPRQMFILSNSLTNNFQRAANQRQNARSRSRSRPRPLRRSARLQQLAQGGLGTVWLK
jgi:hypothetical protein